MLYCIGLFSVDSLFIQTIAKYHFLKYIITRTLHCIEIFEVSLVKLTYRTTVARIATNKLQSNARV